MVRTRRQSSPPRTKAATAVLAALGTTFLSPSQSLLTILSSVHFAHAFQYRPRPSMTASPPLTATVAPLPETALEGGVRYISGRRCLLTPARRRDLRRGNDDDDDDEVSPPPLIVMGGMAQTLEGYEHHLPSLSMHRDVLVYELLGQGPPPSTSTKLADGPYVDVSLPAQASILNDVLSAAFPSQTAFDVVGFSLGGRVALAFASSYPERIRRMHLTGVALHRGTYGRVVLEQWRDLLLPPPPRDEGEESSGDERSRRLRAFAWSAVLATHSDDFLAERGPEQIRSWVDGICRGCAYDGLSAILSQAHPEEEDEWSTSSMARRIAASAEGSMRGRLVVGRLDRMAPPEGSQHLAEAIGFDSNDFEVVEGCGHSVPTEQGRWWRNDVLDFLEGP